MPMCSSRKRTYSIMTNSGFDDLFIFKGNFIIELPQTAINQNTQQVKKFVKKQLDRIDQLSIAEVLHLQNKYGIGVVLT